MIEKGDIENKLMCRKGKVAIENRLIHRIGKAATANRNP